MRRVRYQFGCLKLGKGVQQDVWTFRYYETGSDRKRHYRRIRVGTKAQYPTRAEAMKAVVGLRLSINTGNFQAAPVRFGAVVQHYLIDELPERFSTRASYNSLLRRCIQPRWSDVLINEIRPLDVERLGLRHREILALQWGDIDLLAGTLAIRRSVYQYHVGPVKTSYSESALPLAPEIVSVLQNWLSRARYRADADWVFASDKGGLRDGDKLRESFLQPAADQSQIGKIAHAAALLCYCFRYCGCG